MKITPLQRAVLQAVAQQPCPTMRELCGMFGWDSFAAARNNLNALEYRGLIRRGRIAEMSRLTPAGAEALK